MPGAVLCDPRAMQRLPSVLIVDDHESFRDLARLLLSSEGFEVVGEAHDGASALEAARRLHPDLVLLDVQLPDSDGVAIAHSLVQEYGAPQVVLVSGRERSDFGSRLETDDVLGFVPKDQLTGEAIRELLPASADVSSP